MWWPIWWHWSLSSWNTNSSSLLTDLRYRWRTTQVALATTSIYRFWDRPAMIKESSWRYTTTDLRSEILITDGAGTSIGTGPQPKSHCDVVLIRKHVKEQVEAFPLIPQPSARTHVNVPVCSTPQRCDSFPGLIVGISNVSNRVCVVLSATDFSWQCRLDLKVEGTVIHVHWGDSVTPPQEFMILACFIYPCINFQTSFLCNIAARTCSCRQETRPPSSRVGLVTVKMDKYYIAHGSKTPIFRHKN